MNDVNVFIVSQCLSDRIVQMICVPHPLGSDTNNDEFKFINKSAKHSALLESPKSEKREIQFHLKSEYIL